MFGGDPCPGTLKNLAAEIHCSGDPAESTCAGSCHEAGGGLPSSAPTQIHAQAFEVTEHGGSKVKKLLLVNKGNGTTAALTVEAPFKCMESIDGRAPWQAPVRLALGPGKISVALFSFGVTILTETPCAEL
jgi:hypothetical protein